MAAVWRYRWLVTVVTAFTVALGSLFYLVRPQEVVYESEVTVVIQEPVRSVEAGASQGFNTQFVSSQLEIMRSPIVSQNAIELASEEGVEIDGLELAESVGIVGSPDSPLVTISAQAPSPEEAIIVANSMADAYREVSQRQATATSEVQLNRIDAQVEAIDERLAEIDAELRSLISEDPGLQTLQQQATEAVTEIASLQEELIDAPEDERQEIRDQIADYRQAIAVYNEVVAASTGGPEQQALVEEQALQVDRRARLLTLRDEVAVDTGMAPDAIALVQPATTAEPLAGLGLARVLAVSLVVGLALAVGGAYFLSTSHRVFTTRSEPESILGAPLLVDIPDFEFENLTSTVPVRDHPRSAAAEAFRFAAASTEAGARGTGSRSIFVASATLGHGKTTTVINTAIAAAIHGRSVLVIDCDFGNQEASRLLAGAQHGQLAGVTDVVEGVVSRAEATHHIELGEGIGVGLMPRGTRPSLAASTLQSKAADGLFTDVVSDFDLVFIDGPPLLQVAYASTLAELAEALIVIVEHQGSHSELSDLKNRLTLIGTPVLGYVYNRSPLRREMTMSEGSMMDILGDAGQRHDLPAASQKRRA